MLKSSLRALVLTLALLNLAACANKLLQGVEVKCTHDHVQTENKINTFDAGEERPGGNGRLLQSYPQIRIQSYFGYMTQVPNSYRQYIQTQLVPAVIDFWQATLQLIYPLKNGLTLPSTVTDLCGYDVPNELYNGVNADYYIFFDATDDQENDWIAESTVCYQALQSKRPLVATTMINMQLLQDPQGDELTHEMNLYLMMHEMTHTFGFSAIMFPYYLDSNGDRLQGHILKQTLDGKTSYSINVPAITDRLRAFFGCSSLQGAYLENDGGGGTQSSHFERRHFTYDYMTSGLMYQLRISEFGLAMLESTGWYVPNYNFAEPYFFGQGQGCGFLFDKCATANTKFEEFCTTKYQGCTFQGDSGAMCASDALSDGCNYFYALEALDCRAPNTPNNARLGNLQRYGTNSQSKCFTGDLSSSPDPTPTSFCFDYQCTGSGSNTELQVSVGSRWVITCTESGHQEIPGYYGGIDCPDPIQFCSTVGRGYCPRNCMGRGSCVNNQCVCNNGYTGVDCSWTTDGFLT